ncbi:MAG: hypothetical protein P0120_15030 [Nitrospira sp.]|nr:hypothetical protein [Nitrospira sp.]
MKLTRSAVERLKALSVVYPEDPIVRVQVKDVDDQRLAFSITLEDRAEPDIEYTDPSGCRFRTSGIRDLHFFWPYPCLGSV